MERDPHDIADGAAGVTGCYAALRPQDVREGPTCSLDPQVEAMRDRRVGDGVPPLYTLSLARPAPTTWPRSRPAAATPEQVAEVTDTFNGDLRVRVYRPERRPEPGRAGVLLRRRLDPRRDRDRRRGGPLPGQRGRLVVVVPEYRLAPEHRFPAAVHDAYAGLRWVHEHAGELRASRRRIAVGGDSAGGNLAAAVTLLARKARRRADPRAQLLVYPNTDHGSTTPSATAYDQPWMFNRHSVDWYWDHYLADPADGADPLASPLREPDLSGLPRRWSSPPSTTRCATRPRRTPYGMRQSGVHVIIARYPA